MVTGAACVAEIAATVVSGVTAPVTGGAIPIVMGVSAGKTCAAAFATSSVADTTAFATQAFSIAQGEMDYEGQDSVKIDKQKNGTPGNNRAQNKQVNDVVKQLKLTQDQRETLHDLISGENMSY